MQLIMTINTIAHENLRLKNPISVIVQRITLKSSCPPTGYQVNYPEAGFVGEGKTIEEAITELQKKIVFAYETLKFKPRAELSDREKHSRNVLLGSITDIENEKLKLGSQYL